MLGLFRVGRCADGALWAPWMCDVVGGSWRVCERRAWFDGMIVKGVYLWRNDCKVCIFESGLLATIGSVMRSIAIMSSIVKLV